ncbi:MAG: ATPase [Clostridia bacterium]|nr:ATPase [Clostridia bacterium]
MDREGTKIDKILDKISPRERIGIEMQESKLIYSVIGFISASDFADNSILISNLGYLLAQKGLNTCVVDFKVFYPNLYQALDAQPVKKGSGLIKVLKSDKIDIRDEITPTKHERLYLLSPSPQDLMEEYFDFTFEAIERVIDTLKSIFDIVLIDIPNNPPLEFCGAAMKYCHVGFFTASERMDAYINMIKLLDFLDSIGISTAKFTNVIFMNLQGMEFDYEVFKKFNFNIVAALPLVKSLVSSSFEGKLYIKDDPLLNKHIKSHMNRVVEILLKQQWG